MWIILLDHSGSMGDPFTGKKEVVGRSKASKAAIKLEAAKQALLEHLQGLGSTSDIALIEFTSSASVIFKGSSADFKEVQRILASLQAYDGTDISVALDTAAEYERILQNVLTVRVLVISDGLSDRGRAEVAARKLAVRRVVIDLILIDPTEQGESVARAITAINGSFWSVTSSEELSEQVDVAGEQERAQAELAAAIMGDYEKETAAIIDRIRAEDRLAFTVGYPGVVSPEIWYSLLIYLHIAGLQDQAGDLLRQRSAQLGLQPAKYQGGAFSQIQRGTILKFTPRIEGFICNPPTPLEVAWYEDIQDISFRLKAEPHLAGRFVVGCVEVEVGPVQIAAIPLSLKVRAPGEPEETVEVTPATFQSYRSIFSSYSYKDKNIVEACKAAYKALAISVHIDKDYLKSGEKWNPALHQLIQKSDLFQLYWSNASRQSKNVEDEWRYALSILGQKGESFIRPLRWEEPFPPLPPELSHIHVGWLDIDALVRHTGHSIKISEPVGTPTTAQKGQLGHIALLPLHAAVLPILPDTSQEATTMVREDVARAVIFLEEVTRLRYYPAPTLLVDDYAVKSVRVLNAVDLPPANNADKDEILALADIVQSLCLCFHMQYDLWNVRSEKVNFDNVSSYLGKGNVLTEAQFDAIKGYCEWIINSLIKEHFEPAWHHSLSLLNSKLPEVSTSQTFLSFVLNVLDYILVMMREKEKSSRQTIEVFFYEGRNIWTSIRDEVEPFGITGTEVNRGGRSDFRLKGTLSAFARTIESLRTILIAVLPQYNDNDRLLAKKTDEAGVRCLAAARVIGKICYELSGGELAIFQQSGITLENGNKLTGDQATLHLHQCCDIGDWVQDIIDPQWRQIRNDLLALNLGTFSSGLPFVGFISTFLGIVHRLMQTGLQNVGDFEYRDGYSIELESWQLLCKEMPDLQLNAERMTDWNGKETILLNGSFSEFIRVFDEASRQLTEVLGRKVPKTSPTQQLLLTTVPTYGIYAPPDSLSTDEALRQWALKREVPAQFTLPQSPRVLLCLSARQRFEEQLAGKQGDNSAELAKLFQRCTLIHEHFHAILALGLDSKHAPATGAQLASWQAALPLNESLAVWMELHFARENPELTNLIRAYIQAGSYPDWPYRGAEYIEDLYRQKGIGAIRELIAMMRQQPEVAQAELDTLSKMPGNSLLAEP